MAKIMKTNQQELALKEINENLKVIETLNLILKNEEISDCKIKITGKTNEGIVNEQVAIPFIIISNQLKDHRKRLIKDILDKSKLYNIVLDEEENKIINC